MRTCFANTSKICSQRGAGMSDLKVVSFNNPAPPKVTINLDELRTIIREILREPETREFVRSILEEKTQCT